MRGMPHFLFVKLVQQRRTQNHAKPGHRVRRSSGQPLLIGLAKNSDIGKKSRAYAFGREMVCSQKSVRNRNFFENAGHVSFSFCQTGSAETHTKPCKTSPQGTSIKQPAIYWDHAVSWGGGGWVSVSDIGRVGKK